MLAEAELANGRPSCMRGERHDLRPVGSIASYDWQWGDATADEHSAKPAHVFAAPGTYQVALFVLDDNTHQLRFTLKAPAKVTVTIARRARDARHGKRCVSPRRAHGKRCTRAVKAGTLTRKNLANGGNTIAFSGRVGKRALKPGAYTATLRARNAKGASKPVVVKFTVVR